MNDFELTIPDLYLDLFKSYLGPLGLVVRYGGSLTWWAIGWMGGSCKNTTNQINLDLIGVIQFCFKIGGCMGGWVDW